MFKKYVFIFASFLFFQFFIVLNATSLVSGEVLTGYPTLFGSLGFKDVTFKYMFFKKQPIKYIVNCRFEACVFEQVTNYVFHHSASKNNTFMSCLFESGEFSGEYQLFKSQQTSFIQSMFSSAFFEFSEFHITKFIESDFRSTVFSNSLFVDTDFSTSVFDQVIFLNSTLDDDTLVLLPDSAVIGFSDMERRAEQRDIFEGHIFKNLFFNDLVFDFLSFVDAVFNICTFEKLSLKKMTFDNVSFFLSRFKQVNFGQTVFLDTSFKEVKIENGVFTAATFDTVHVKDSIVYDTSFNQTKWQNVFIENSTCVNCSFKNITTSNITLHNSEGFLF